jgi:hypothetical protein
MYDEIDVVKKNIINLREFNSKIIVVQSDPGNEKMVLNKLVCDRYEKMSDVSGGRDKYAKILEEAKKGKSELIGPIALTRNFSKGFSLIQDFDVNYVIAITGDTKITNLNGILKIIEKMEEDNKMVGATRTIGYTQYDKNGEYTRFQHRQITDIMPQFFVVNNKVIKKGLFCDIKRTNKYTTEQCLGDEIIRYCQQNNLRFFDIFYRISDYAYPRFIDGVHYNPEQFSKIPPSIERCINWIRYWNGNKVNGLITKIFKYIEERLLKNN